MSRFVFYSIIVFFLAIEASYGQLYSPDYFDNYICIEKNTTFHLLPSYSIITSENSHPVIEQFVLEDRSILVKNRSVLGAKDYDVFKSSELDKARLYGFYFMNKWRDSVAIYLYLGEEENEIFNFHKDNFITLSGLNLKKGTYLIDWYHSDKEINRAIHQQLVVRDSLEKKELKANAADAASLLDSMYKANISDAARDDFSKRHNAALLKESAIMYRYFSDADRFKNYYRLSGEPDEPTNLNPDPEYRFRNIVFKIQQPALEQQQLSNQVLSVDEIRKYLIDPDKEKTETVRKLLDVFQH